MIPPSYVRINHPMGGFLATNGPFYAKRDGKRVWMGIPIEDRHCNTVGTAHGGMIMTLCDVMLTAGSNIQLDLQRYLVTVSFSCDFVGAAKSGTWIEGEIEVIRQTRSYVFAQLLLVNADGSPVARASATLVYRGEPEARFSAERYFEGSS